jgi:diguanylate cyclase (GGDEF)-like protein
MKSKLAIAVTLWGWLLFVVWLSYDYAVYQDRWIIHIFQPAYSYEIHAFHILIILIPFIYTLLGYLIAEREKLLTKVKQSEEKYRELSLLDELTGIYNRRGFDFLAEQQLKKADRTKNRMLLLYADVDNVKWINDKFGHQEGDKALIDIAGILKKHIRKSDILARISGDEFVALMDKTTDDLPQIIAKRLREGILNNNIAGTHSYKLFLSIGFAHYDPTSPCSLQELLNHADEDMYKQKKKKKENIK